MNLTATCWALRSSMICTHLPKPQLDTRLNMPTTSYNNTISLFDETIPTQYFPNTKAKKFSSHVYQASPCNAHGTQKKSCSPPMTSSIFPPPTNPQSVSHPLLIPPSPPPHPLPFPGPEDGPSSAQPRKPNSNACMPPSSAATGGVYHPHLSNA